MRVSVMKKKIILSAAFLLSMLFLAGCGKDSADKYVGEEITSMKKEKADCFAAVLEDGIAKSNQEYVLQFPEELKEPYQKFLQECFKTIEFEVASAKKGDDGNYKVDVTYTPLNVGETLKSSDSEKANALKSSDLTAETSALLESDAKILADKPKYQAEVISTLKVKKDGDSFAISNDSLKAFLSQALYDCMEPYNAVCEILDVQNFMQSYLDASFKGEVEQFAKHTNRTEEEALAWYETETFDPPSDLGEAYVQRYKDALKNIMKQCQYTTGIPKKDAGGFNYTMDVTVVPNNSLIDAMNEFQQGTYYSIDEVSAGLVATLEKYAAAPTFGEETTVNVPVNFNSLISAGEDNADLTNLSLLILPTPE